MVKSYCPFNTSPLLEVMFKSFLKEEEELERKEIANNVYNVSITVNNFNTPKPAIEFL